MNCRYDTTHVASMISLLIYMFYRIRAALEFEIELKESIQGVFKEDNDNYP